LSRAAFQIKYLGTDASRQEGMAMRAETEAMVQEIKQSLELLRRHL
jgi:hypothetical protein